MTSISFTMLFISHGANDSLHFHRGTVKVILDKLIVQPKSKPMKKITQFVGTALLAMTWMQSFAGGPPSTTCTDLNEYVPDVKEVGSTGNYTLQGGSGNLSRAAQTYLYSGQGRVQSVTVNGAVPAPYLRAQLVAKIYNVDASNRPTSLVATSYSEYFYFWETNQMFDFPGSGPYVTGNFAVSVEIVNASDITERFDVAYTGDGEGLNEDLASLSGSSTGFNWSSAMTNYSKNGDFYIMPNVRHNILSSFTKSGVCFSTGSTVSFTNTSPITQSPMFNMAAPIFEWDFGDGSSAVSTQNASHAYSTPGVYTVSLTTYFEGYGGTSCSSYSTQEISVGLANSATVTNVTCFGSSNGSISSTGTGGKPPYQFALHGGSWQSSGNFSGLAAGSYVVYIKDALGCTNSTTVTITQPTQVLISSVSSSNASCGQADGSLTISASGGTGTLQYSVNGGAYTTNNNFVSLAAGTYTISVKDANNCIATTTKTISDAGAPSLTVQSYSNISCNGGNDGSIVLQGSGGTGAYQYSINGTTFQSSGTFNGLAAGTYGVLVKDNAGCITGTNVTLSEPPALANFGIQVNQHVSCNGYNNGQIQVVVGTGGTGSYVYSLNGINFQSSPVFSNLSAGAYNVTVKDVTGCTFALNTTVNQPAVLSATANTTTVTCPGGSNGSIFVAVTGGTAPYTYSLGGESSYTGDNYFEELEAGNYTIYVIDANGCETSVIATITEPASINATVLSTQATCGNADGGFLVTGSGGNGAPFSYSRDGVNFISSGSFTGLSAGNYAITVRDQFGCEETFTALITTTTGPSINTVSSTNVSCFDGTDGSVNVTNVTGGTGALSYSIDGSGFQSSPSFTGLTAGSHTVVVQDAVGCTSSSTINLTQPAMINLNGVVTDATCFGASNGSVVVTSSGGIGVIAYSTDGSNFQSSNTFVLGAGNYTITAKDAAGCTATSSFIVEEPEEILIGAGYLNISCYGANDGEIFVNSSGGTGAHEYAIDGGAFGSFGTFVGLEGGIHTIYVHDANNCVASIAVNIDEPSPIVTTAHVTDVSCAGGDNGVIDLSVSGGTPGYSFAWDNEATTEDAFNLNAGTYGVTITDQNGCFMIGTYTVSEPANPIIVNGTVVNAGGPTNTDGSIDITVTGGTAPYAYDWSNSATSQDISTLSPGVYWVEVTDANGCSASASFTVSWNVGVNEAQAAVTNLYPNPANNYITVEADAVMTSITFVNLVGQVVYTSAPQSMKSTIDLSNVANGIYFVQIVANGKTITKKVEVVK